MSPQFHTTDAQDNRHPDREEASRRDERNAVRRERGIELNHPELTEAQASRDGAEMARQQAVQGQAANTDNNRDAVEQSAKLGGGPAGLNQGPSDTVSGDPHKPRQAGDLYTGQDRSHETGGTGFSPPQGGAPTSDKPALRVPAEDAAKLSGTDAAKSAGATARGETEDAKRTEGAAIGERTDAERTIAGNQSPGPGPGAIHPGPAGADAPNYSGSGESQADKKD